MMIPMSLGAQSYDIVLENGALCHAQDVLELQRKVLIVTDSGVPEAYADTLAAQCLHPVIVRLEAGEASKSFDNYRRLLSTMLRADFTRGDCVAAVGGGMAGDLSGFAAAGYMRGIDFYNLPTTLLSQVDSSIGGKTAINFEGVKNAVGAFYQPRRVLIDPETLSTLSPRQLRSGLAEAIKMAVTCDAELFSRLETCQDLTAALPEIIERSLRIKKNVVEQDPKEQGLRRVLNFGHTLGHALESAHDGALLHGECVALGMLPLCAPSIRPRVEAVLERYGLPTRWRADAQSLLPYLLHDKKANARRITAVLADEIGSFSLREMQAEELMSLWEELQ